MGDVRHTTPAGEDIVVGAGREVKIPDVCHREMYCLEGKLFLG